MKLSEKYINLLKNQGDKYVIALSEITTFGRIRWLEGIEEVTKNILPLSNISAKKQLEEIAKDLDL